MAVENLEYSFKILLLGDAETGRSSIVRRFCEDIIISSQNSINYNADFINQTEELEYSVKIVSVSGHTVKLILSDSNNIAGNKNIDRSVLEGWDGAIVVYDITRKETFEDGAKFWVQKILETAPSTEIILVGSKCDKTDDRVVSIEEALEFANNKAIQLFEVSAKENTNVYQVFQILAKKIVRKEKEIGKLIRLNSERRSAALQKREEANKVQNKGKNKEKKKKCVIA